MVSLSTVTVIVAMMLLQTCIIKHSMARPIVDFTTTKVHSSSSSVTCNVSQGSTFLPGSANEKAPTPSLSSINEEASPPNRSPRSFSNTGVTTNTLNLTSYSHVLPPNVPLSYIYGPLHANPKMYKHPSPH